ncbi:crosslink repair DNA glycosylase YcaQ family protein [Amycolatopsis sp. SID8362]|uniref:winged helix-turn-helix domain-containing protein n=1 Tax=Amycolatopsis sp. SID8362 TaxID=2690346 RepID=UPI001368AFD8|nr:crosslink repair DNA glycosylase YcaQ family protein [Amycolatopsis sp. SID8362]NBH05046.1 winged helix-turn-helix domain-containing protein [Amycolatopsis sp. SID8362]NED41746.1 winged helix-turn-helix domain-containing protein [Amycolatopsis sp. SID8362]
MQTISVPTARKTFLAAQGFTDPRPSGEPSRRHLKRVLSRVQLLQLDSVNVAVRAHYMPVFSRLGAYEPALLDAAAWSHSARRPRLMVETWAHEASLLPIEDWPLIRSGAKRDGWWRHYGPLIEKSPGLVDEILSVVKELGPIGAGGIEREVEADAQRRGPGSWWERSEVKRVCEYLFGIGQLTTGTRRSFERLYDLTERVVPPDVLARTVSAEEGARGLIERSARALGVATETDLRDYYRLGPAPARQAVAELVESGVLEPVSVRGWKAVAYRHAEARTPRSVTGRALLCPFDPLIWERARTERLFGFHYRIEIYVPEPKRVYGYYVFPFLLDGELVARVDLKSDRAAGVLRVHGAFAEVGADKARVLPELAGELRHMAEWLGLSGVAVGTRGDLAKPLAKLVR